MQCKNCQKDIKPCEIDGCVHKGFKHISNGSHWCDYDDKSLQAEPATPATIAATRSNLDAIYAKIAAGEAGHEDFAQFFRAASLKQETQPPSDKQLDAIVLCVAELPDRSSPDDWPEAMLVTAEELKTIIRETLASSSPLETPAAVPKYCKFCGNDAHKSSVHKSAKGPAPLPKWCEYCHGHYAGDFFQHESNCNAPTTPAPADTGAAATIEKSRGIMRKGFSMSTDELQRMADTGDTPQPQRQKEVIERLCKLTAWVGENVFGNMEAYDCFCGENPHRPENYQFSEQVLQHIENKVKAATGKTPDAREWLRQNRKRFLYKGEPYLQECLDEEAMLKAFAASSQLTQPGPQEKA